MDSRDCLAHYPFVVVSVDFREVRSTAYQLKAARFPNYRDLTGFDFASSELNEALVRQLHRCEFLEDAHNVVLVGGTEPDS